MNRQQLLKQWKAEEDIAYIHGWDFSHLDGRMTEDTDFGWDYKDIVLQNLSPDKKMLDMDTGGGEFLLTLGHPYNNTSATEGYAPNVNLCRETLLPLGIDFKEASDYSSLPFADEQFDIVINRHGSFDAKEINRILKKGGLFITQQVGDRNDRELVELLMPGTPPSFSGLNLADQTRNFENSGFRIVKGMEAFRPMRFFDVGALVWFARIIQWEFPGFSVDRYSDNLFNAYNLIKEKGSADCTTHRYLIVAEKLQD